MALRFRTRLNLTIISLVFLVVSVMTAVVLVIFGVDMWRQNWQQGTLLTQVTTRNIEYGLSLPGQVGSHIENQLLAQAYLTAELVALAERTEPNSPGDISSALQRALDRMSEDGRLPFVNQFTVTNAHGTPYIYTGDTARSRSNPPAIPEKLLPLLSPKAMPIIEHADDAEADTYAAVSGVDKPRIVQVSANPLLLDTMGSYFSLQQLAERFMLDDEYRGIVIVDTDGNIVAEAGEMSLDSSLNLRQHVQEASERFLRSPPKEMVAYDPIGREGSLIPDIGVITPLLSPTGELTHALYVLHNVSRQATYILDRLGVLITVGFVLFMMSLIVTIFLSRGLSKPLVELARGAREFGAGNFNFRLRMRRKDEFNDLAQSFNTMAISIQEYVHELEQETSRRERLESEFRIAAELQRTLLPEAPPEVKGLVLTGWSQPSKEVGGDFYDFIELGEGRIAIVLGDATGKGLSAALLSTQCSSILRTIAGHAPPASELLRQTNNEFYKRIGTTHRFVTLFLIIIDTKTGVATYASAGHPPALLVNAGTQTARWLTSEAGYPLGIMGDATFTEAQFQLQPHDTIVIYSDGLTDAQNHAGTMYGEDRIERVVKKNAGESADAILAGLRSDAKKHMGGKDPIDDMTLVAIHYDPASRIEPG